MLKELGTLQSISIPPTIWNDISMEFIVGLPKSRNNLVIMVVLDRLSKYFPFFPLQHPLTASNMTQLFMNKILKIHGIPDSFYCLRF